MSILLDEKRGVNPGMMNCFLCNEPKGLILWGKLTHRQKTALQEAGIKEGMDGDAPSNVVIDEEPCEKCAGYMKQGIILISVRNPDDHGDDERNPHRTGGWCVVRDEAIKRWGIQPRELLEAILVKRMAFLPDEVWDMIGLPREEVATADSTDTAS